MGINKEKLEIETSSLGQRDISRSAIINTEFEEEEDYSPYCKNCNACGEDPCCSALMCMYNSMTNNEGCDYGITYFNDTAFYYNLGQELYDLISEHGDDNLKKLLEEKYDKLWEEIYKE